MNLELKKLSIENRIHKLSERKSIGNAKIIAKLKRELRALEK